MSDGRCRLLISRLLLLLYLQFKVGEPRRVAESLGERIRVNLELRDLRRWLWFGREGEKVRRLEQVT